MTFPRLVQQESATPCHLFCIASMIAALVLTAGVAFAEDASGATASVTSSAAAAGSNDVGEQGEQPQKEPKSETAESVQPDVEKDVEDKTAEKRQKLVEEAVSTVNMTRDALASLDKDKTDEALETLEKITGKLELLVARNPSLALIPVGVTTTIYDLFAEVETVETIVEEAHEALEDGDVQTARRLLDNLASEIVISTTKLPLATYPDAIKRVAPLIDDGKIDEAKQQLQTALNLLIVSDVIYPLPNLRSNVMLNEAQELSEKSDRTDEENDRLKELLEEVRSQVEFGRELGYFTEENSDDIQEELEQIEEKTKSGKSGQGFFEKIKELFDW